MIKKTCKEPKPSKCKDKECICNPATGLWKINKQKKKKKTIASPSVKSKQKAARKIIKALKSKQLCNPQPFSQKVKDMVDQSNTTKTIPDYKFTRTTAPLKEVAPWFRSITKPFNPSSLLDLIQQKAVSTSFIKQCELYISNLNEDDKQLLRHYSNHGDGTINHYIREGALTFATIKRVFDHHTSSATFLTQKSVAYADTRVKLPHPVFFKDKKNKKYIITPSVVKGIGTGPFVASSGFQWMKQLLNYIVLRLRYILNNAPKIDKDVYVFRGNRNKYGFLAKSDVSRIESFSSYSINPRIALNFAGTSKTNWISRLTVMKGTPLLYIANMSDYPSEQEVLLPDGGLYIHTYKCPNKLFYEFRYYSGTSIWRTSVKFGAYLWSKKTSEKNSKIILNKMFKGLNAKSVMKNKTKSPFFYKPSPKKSPPPVGPPKTSPNSYSAVSSLRAPKEFTDYYPNKRYPAAALLMKDDKQPNTVERLKRYVQHRGISNTVVSNQKFYFKKHTKKKGGLFTTMFKFYYKYSKVLNTYYHDRTITPHLKKILIDTFKLPVKPTMSFESYYDNLINGINDFIYKIPKYKKTDLFVFSVTIAIKNNRSDSLVYASPMPKSTNALIESARIRLSNPSFITTSSFMSNNGVHYDQILLPIGGTLINKKTKSMSTLFHNKIGPTDVTMYDWKQSPMLVTKKKTPSPKKVSPKKPSPKKVSPKKPSPNKVSPPKDNSPMFGPAIVKKKTPSPEIVKKKKFKIKKKDLHPPCREPAPSEDYDCRCGWVKK